MRLWRITQPKYALDRLCAGAALYGGRWNPIGHPALYCGASVAITALEKLVHLGSGPRPSMVLVAIDMPDAGTIYEPGVDHLPSGWNTLPTSPAAQAFGGAWLLSKTSLAMRVPSVILPEESNIVINPQHPAYPQVTLSVLRPFAFDMRLPL